MRLRNIQGARDAIADSPLVIHEPEKAKEIGRASCRERVSCDV